MPCIKRIVCLANSRKLGGHCVAGKEVKGKGYGEWIRPIGSTGSGELSDQDISFQNREAPQTLDIIDVPLDTRAPYEYQSENYLIDGKFYWEHKGRLNIRSLPSLCDSVDSLWINGFSSGNGVNDRVPIDLAGRSLTSYLLLIRPAELSLVVAWDYNSRSRKVRAEFSFRDDQYRLVVTDPIIESTYLKEEGTYRIKRRNAYICVSLGEPYRDYTYKLVAAILNFV